MNIWSSPLSCCVYQTVCDATYSRHSTPDSRKKSVRLIALYIALGKRDVFNYRATTTFKGKEVWVLNAKMPVLMDSSGVFSKEFAIQKAVFKPLPK